MLFCVWTVLNGLLIILFFNRVLPYHCKLITYCSIQALPLTVFYWNQILMPSLKFEKCHSMSFPENVLLSSITFNSSSLKQVDIIKDLGFFYIPSFSFKHYFNITDERVFKTLGFLKRYTNLFTPPTFLRTLGSVDLRILNYNLTFLFNLFELNGFKITLILM